MATRKRTVLPPGMSLFGPDAPPEKPTYGVQLADHKGRPVLLTTEPPGTPIVGERSLRLVPPPSTTPESEVIIEALSDGRFQVSLLRDHGTTVAAVRYTRAQLEMLLRRIPAALEVG